VLTEHPIAPNHAKPNPLTGYPVRFCWSRFNPGEAPKDLENAHLAGEQLDATQAHVFLQRMSVEPLVRGYVLLVPTTGFRGRPDERHVELLVCRTSADGTLVTIDEASISSAVPTDKARILWLPPGQSFAYFWTQESQSALFRRVLDGCKASLTQSLERYGFDEFTVRHHSHKELAALPAFDVPPLLKGRLRLLVHGCAPSLGQRQGPGLFTGAALNNAALIGGATSLTPTAHYVLAQSQPVAATYLAALIVAEAVDVRLRAAAQYGAMHVAESAHAQASDDAWTVDHLEKAPELSADRDRYRRYARDCARKNVPAGVFRRAIDVRVNHHEWMVDANNIMVEFSVPHPCLRAGQTTINLATWDFHKVSNPTVIENYFDFFRFGAQQDMSWLPAMRQAEAQMVTSIAASFEAAAKLLAGTAAYELFLCDLGAHQGAADADLGCRLHRLWHDTAVKVQLIWWPSFSIEDKATYDRIEPFLNWLATFTDKAGALFGEHFGSVENAILYQRLFESKGEDFERLVAKLSHFNTHLGNQVAERLEVQIDWERGTLNLARGGVVDEIGPLLFVREVEPASARALKGHVPQPAGYANGATYQLAQGREAWHAAPAKITPTIKPAPTIHAWPAYMAAFGDFLSLAMSLYSLSRDLKTKGKLEVFGKVTQNAAQLIDSAAGAATTVRYLLDERARRAAGLDGFVGQPLKIAGKLGTFVRWATRAGIVIEAAFNVRDAVLLFGDFDLLTLSKKQGDLTKAREDAEDAIAVAHQIKGGAVILAMTGGVVTAAATMALAPLATACAVSALFVLPIDMGIYIFKGAEPMMDAVRQSLERALLDERIAETRDDKLVLLGGTPPAVAALALHAERVDAIVRLIQ
jgi:hypothetical protein